jgi:hypothetical protein
LAEQKLPGAQSLSVLQATQPEPSLLHTVAAPQATQPGPQRVLRLQAAHTEVLHQVPAAHGALAPHWQPVAPQLSAEVALQAAPQAVQLAKSVARLRHARCVAQQVRPAPHALSSTMPLQSSSQPLHTSGCGKPGQVGQQRVAPQV